MRTGFAAVLIQVLSTGLAFPTGAGEVTVERGQLTVDIGQESVAEVLGEVARQTGAELTIRGDLGQTHPQAFQALPLSEALTRLAGTNGLMLQFAPSSSRSRGSRLLAIHAVSASGTAGTTPATAVSGSGVPGRPPQRGGPAVPQRVQWPPGGLWNYEDGVEKLPSVDERIKRIQELRQRPSPNTSAGLVYVLTADPDASVRRMAVQMITSMKSTQGRDGLFQATSDEDPTVRAEAFRALGSGMMGSEKPVPLLVSALRTEHDRDVKMTVVSVLSGRDGDEARAVLSETAANSTDPQLRDMARAALTR